MLRNEVAGFGIDVVVIEPGGIASEWGDIEVDEANRYSGNSAYSGLVAAFKQAQSRIKSPPLPTVITDLVVRAITVKKPKARYVGG